MSRSGKRMEKQSNKTFRKMFIVAVFIFSVVCVLYYARKL